MFTTPGAQGYSCKLKIERKNLHENKMFSGKPRFKDTSTHWAFATKWQKKKKKMKKREKSNNNTSTCIQERAAVG